MRLAAWASALLMLILALPARAEAPFADISYAQALDRAKDEKKLVFIDFYTSWCGPCKQLDRTTWKDTMVVDFLARNTIPLKIDAEDAKQGGAKLAQQFKVRAYPTMVFIKPDGSLAGTIMGYKNAEDFLKAAGPIAGITIEGINSLDRLREEAHNMGPHGRFTFAKKLIAEKLYDEALGEYMWCLENSSGDRSFAPLRSSILITDIIAFSKIHPPMGSALVSFRDGLRDSLIAGQGDWAEANLVVAISDELGDSATANLIPMYDATAAGCENKIILQTLRQDLMGPLLDAGRVEEAAAGRDVAREGLALIRRQTAVENQKERRLNEWTEADRKAALDAERRAYTRRAARYYQLFLMTDKPEDAEAIKKAMLAFDDTWLPRTALAAAALRAGKVAPEHADLAEQAVNSATTQSIEPATTLIRVLVALGRTEDAARVAESLKSRSLSDVDRKLIDDSLKTGA